MRYTEYAALPNRHADLKGIAIRYPTRVRHRNSAAAGRTDGGHGKMLSAIGNDASLVLVCTGLTRVWRSSGLQHTSYCTCRRRWKEGTEYLALNWVTTSE
jgi:hypothetical protein